MIENLEKPITLATNLRNLGVKTEIYLNDKKLKAKFKYADKLKIPYVIVIGEDEIANNIVKVKDMETGEERSVSLEASEIANGIR